MQVPGINRLFDNTLLKPEATWNDIIDFIDKSMEYKVRAIVVPWYAIPYAIARIEQNGVEIGIVVGIDVPLGFSPIEKKLEEINYYLHLSKRITDFDIQLNISAIKSKDWDFVEKELNTLSEIVKKENRTCKVILETSKLSDDEIKKVCELILHTPIDYIKTSSGFGSSPTTYHAVELIHNVVGDMKKIKVSGGVRTLEQVEKFLKLGASIFGSSSTISILEEYRSLYGDFEDS
mgnify:CR=1 FL=1